MGADAEAGRGGRTSTDAATMRERVKAAAPAGRRFTTERREDGHNVVGVIFYSYIILMLLCCIEYCSCKK